jgi:hypothetical protein
MGRMWGREEDPVERSLRAARPHASDELVGKLTERVAGTPRRREWSRVSFAAALTVFMLGTFISFGGLGYASSGAVGSVKIVGHVVVPVKHQVKLRVRTYTSAADEYGSVKTVVKTVTKPTVKTKVLGTRATIKPTTAKAGNTLPFTGFSLLGTVVLGLALVGLGVFLRRRESHSS